MTQELIETEFIELIIEKLNKKERKKLLTAFSWVMERAYRRGVQQSLFLNQSGRVLPSIVDNLHDYRYDRTLRTSFGLDGFKTTSIFRLLCEEPYLSALDDEVARCK